MRDFTTRYGIRRPQEIATRLAEMHARFASEVAESAPVPKVEVAPIAPEVETRAPFVQLYPWLRDGHIRAQRRMFAAMGAAGLSTQIEQRIAGTNALLGLNLRSSTGLTLDEMLRVADAIEAGRFDADWNLTEPLELEPLDDAPFLCEAPPEVEPIETQTTPAPLESLDELAMEFDLAQMRNAQRARALNSLCAQRVLVETQLIDLDRALLVA